MPRPFIPLSIPHYAPIMRPHPALTIDAYDECPAICIQINTDLVALLLGLLEVYRWPDNFEGDTNQINHSLGIIQDLKSALLEACMCCCGDQPTKQFRYNAQGGLEYSDDGGATWKDGSNYDTREQVPIYPPAAALPENSQCLYAENIADKIKEIVDATIASLNNGGGVAAAAPALLSILVVLGFPAAPLATFLILVYGLISAILSLTTAGLTGSFDAAFWADFKCFWNCVIDADGNVTDAMISQVMSETMDRLSSPPNPIAQQVMSSAINMLGAAGLTNAARMGDSILNGDCDDCGCGDTCLPMLIITSGVMIEQGDNWAIIESRPYNPGSGTSEAIVIQFENSACCLISSPETVPGYGITGASYHSHRCDNSVLTGFWIQPECLNDVSIFKVGAPTFRIKFTFNGECS